MTEWEIFSGASFRLSDHLVVFLSFPTNEEVYVFSFSLRYFFFVQKVIQFYKKTRKNFLFLFQTSFQIFKRSKQISCDPIAKVFTWCSPSFAFISVISPPIHLKYRLKANGLSKLIKRDHSVSSSIKLEKCS